jgi:hypothetical protein
VSWPDDEPGARVDRHVVLPVDEASARDIAETDQGRAEVRDKLVAAIKRGEPIIAIYPENGEIAFTTFGSAETQLLARMLIVANHGSAGMLDQLLRDVGDG